jgi:DNA-binding transcriptional ArsR family regulator
MKNNKYHFFFGNLSNPLKIDVISALKKKNMSVSELIQELRVEQSKLSHALASLRRCHIVEVKRKGKKRIYSLNKKTILPILKILDKHEKKYCKKCCYNLNEGKKNEKNIP